MSDIRVGSEYLLAYNTGVHNVAIMDRNEERFDSTILLAIDGACKHDSDARISNGCRGGHISAHRKIKRSDRYPSILTWQLFRKVCLTDALTSEVIIDEQTCGLTSYDPSSISVHVVSI